MIYSETFLQYNKKFRVEDLKISQNIKLHFRKTLQDLGAKHTFWLKPAEQKLFCTPYQTAIEKFRGVPDLRSPLQKVRCLVSVVKEIEKCVLRFWERRDPPSSISLTADDLVSIFAYIVIQAKVDNLYSECEFQADFLSQSDCNDIGGYALATFQTSLGFLQAL